MTAQHKFAPWNQDFRISFLYSVAGVLFLLYAAILWLADGKASIVQESIFIVCALLANRLSARRIASGERRLFGIKVEQKYIPVLAAAAAPYGWQVHHDVAIPGRRENIDALIEKNGKKYVVEIKSMSAPGKIRSVRQKHKKQVLRQSELIGASGSVLWYPLSSDYFEDIYKCGEIGGCASKVIDVVENYDARVKKHRRFVENIRFPDVFASDRFDGYRDILKRVGLRYRDGVGWYGTVNYDAARELDRVLAYLARMDLIVPQRQSQEVL